MIHNPWYVDNTINYNQQRIEDEMRQIRLEQTAMKAASPKTRSSGSHPTFFRAAAHTALVMAQAVVVVLLG